MRIQKIYSLLIFLIISIIKYRLKCNPNYKYELNSKYYYLKEFATIRINLGRKSGHSTYINKQLHKDNNFLINNSNCKLSHFYNVFNKDFMKNIEFTIWIDDPSKVFKNQALLDDFYRFVAKNTNIKLIVMLGY